MKRTILFVLLLSLMGIVRGQMRQADVFSLSQSKSLIFLAGEYGNMTKKSNPAKFTYHLSSNKHYELKVVGKGESCKFHLSFNQVSIELTGEIETIEIDTDDKPMDLIISVYPPNEKKGGYAFTLMYNPKE